mgnify:CR=1 FL=1
MKKIGVAGLQREQIKKTIEATAPGCFEVFIHNDMEAAMKVKSGQLDYYIGACNTGAGAALSIAIAVIGYNKSCTIAKPGSVYSDYRGGVPDGYDIASGASLGGRFS